MGSCQSAYATKRIDQLTDFSASLKESSKFQQQCGHQANLAKMMELQLRLPANNDDDNGQTFSLKEIQLLRSSFYNVVTLRRDQVAMEMSGSVAAHVAGAGDVLAANCYKLSDTWAVLGIGIILLSGMERCLLRLDKPQFLRTIIERLVHFHEKSIKMDPRMMHAALRACQPVFLPHICRFRNRSDSAPVIIIGNSDNGENSGPVCSVVATRASEGSALSALSSSGCCELCKVWVKFFDHICDCFSNTIYRLQAASHSQ